jgi:isopenicillin N synthase-like dioxygenase
MSRIPPATRHPASGFVPVLDLAAAQGSAADRRDLARTIGRTCQTSGFLIAVNHGIPAAATATLGRATEDFFALPAAVKSALTANPKDPLMRGYGGRESTRESAVTRASPRARPTLAPATEVGHLETFGINRLGEPALAGQAPAAADPALYAPNRWPALPGFRDAYLDWFGAAERLAMRIMGLFALALDLPAGWFDQAFANHMTGLAANFYPPRSLAPSVRLRKGEHTDWGTLTILHRDRQATGLEVLDQTGRWREVPTLPDSLVINIGDLMARWTNDRWPSTVHRVVYPPGGNAQRARYSVAFFHQPSPDAVIECIPTCAEPGKPPRYPPVRFADFLTQKARRAYLMRRLSD